MRTTLTLTLGWSAFCNQKSIGHVYLCSRKARKLKFGNLTRKEVSKDLFCQIWLGSSVYFLRYGMSKFYLCFSIVSYATIYRGNFACTCMGPFFSKSGLLADFKVVNRGELALFRFSRYHSRFCPKFQLITEAPSPVSNAFWPFFATRNRLTICIFGAEKARKLKMGRRTRKSPRTCFPKFG